jgi:tetratricopeptide (TPR) repeat protein
VSARAWHLSAAALGPDETAASALDAAAQAARERGVHSAAAAASARAAELSEDDTHRVERLAAAAEDFAEAGRLDDALARAEEAASYPESEPMGSRLRILRGRVELRHGGIDAGRAMLVEEAERCAEGNPAPRPRCCSRSGSPTCSAATRRAGWTPRRAPRSSRSPAATTSSPGSAGWPARWPSCRSAPPSTPSPVLMDALPLLLEGDPLPAASELVTFAGQQLMWMEHLDLAEQVLSRQIDAAREASALGRLVFPLAARAQLHDRRGRWAAAVAEAAEAVQLGRETSQPIALAMALSVLGSLEAARGQHDESRAHGEEAVAIMRQFGGPIGMYAEVALGFTALASEQLEDAVRHLQAADRIKREVGGREPSIIQYESDLIEALTRLGRRDEAEQALTQLEADAELTGRSWAHAVAARARGMMADDESYAEHFDRALAWHARSPQPFPEARTKLAYGERLRRAGERVAAREQLSAAAEAFERVNAAPWAQRAQNELRGTGRRCAARRCPNPTRSRRASCRSRCASPRV